MHNRGKNLRKFLWFLTLLSLYDFHTKFHPYQTKIGKVSVFGWVRGVWGRVVGVIRGVESKYNSEFELCCPFFTATPSFIQIGPKSAKLVLSGGLGGLG